MLSFLKLQKLFSCLHLPDELDERRGKKKVVLRMQWIENNTNKKQRGDI